MLNRHSGQLFVALRSNLTLNMRCGSPSFAVAAKANWIYRQRFVVIPVVVALSAPSTVHAIQRLRTRKHPVLDCPSDQVMCALSPFALRLSLPRAAQRLFGSDVRAREAVFRPQISVGHRAAALGARIWIAAPHLRHRPKFFGLAIRCATQSLSVIRGIQGSANPRHENILQVAPINIRPQFFAPHSCKILDNKAALLGDATGYPVRDRLRFGLTAEHFGKLAHASGPVYGPTQCFSSDVWIRCLHAHRLYTPCEFSQLLCEFSL